MWEFESKIEDFKDTSGVWACHFIVPDIVVEDFKEANKPRLLCTLNLKITYNCALMSKGNGTYFINVNKEIRKKLGITIGSVISVKLEEDKSKYGMPMPEEMAEILTQDQEVDTLFHQLTPGKQRTLLHLIGKPKGAESRIKKAILVTRYIKLSGGKIDFKEMNEYIKNNNTNF